MWKPPFNKAHLKVLTTASCTTGYSPWATLYYDTIMGTFLCHYVIGGVSRGLFPAWTVVPLGDTISQPPKEARPMQQTGRKQGEIDCPVERLCSRACPMHGKSCILAVAIILPIISKRLKPNDVVSSASCHCYSEIWCYKISHSRRAGGQKQLVSHCLELTGGYRVVSQLISFCKNPHNGNRVRKGRQN